MNRSTIFFKSLLTLIFSLLSTIAQAQLFAIHPLPNQEKLPQSEIYRFFQDSEGYMWYATQGTGLCRDNGYQIDIFRADRWNPELLRSNAVTCIAENIKEHEIWFGTKQGAYILDKYDYSVRPLENVYTHVKDIKQAADGSMWVAVSKEMKVFTAKGELTDSFALSWKGQAMSVETMTLDSHGILWVLQWNGGVQTIDTHSKQLSTMNWEEPVGPTSLAEDSINHQFYVGTWGAGLFHYDGLKTEPIAPNLTTSLQRLVRSVHYDHWRNILWVVTMAGLYAYNIETDGSLTPFPTSSFGLTSQQAIFQLQFDNRGNIWVPGTTPLSFILRPTSGKWMKRAPLEKLEQDGETRIPIGAFQNDGDYSWMWNDRTQLVLYNHTTGELTMAKGPADKETTRFGDIMCRRKAGGIWCSSGTNLYQCTHQGNKIQLTLKQSLPRSITALLEGPDDCLFIGTGDALYRYHDSKGELITIAEGLRTVRDIAITPQGRVYFISLEHGLCSSDGKKGYTIMAPYQHFTKLAYSNNGQLWVANAYGDVWYADSTLHHTSVASSDKGSGVKGLLCDSLNHLWVMGDTYLMEYHPESDRRRLFRSSDYGINLSNFGDLSMTNDGKVLVAGAGAIITFEPKNLELNEESKQPSVAAYTLDGKKHLLSKLRTQIDIPSDVVTLELELTAYYYLKASELQFAYRLKGLSDKWIELPLGDNTLRVVNLPKGNYELELKFCDSYAHWGKPITALKIHRLPTWYETWWAYTCYVLLLALLIYWIIRFYLKRNSEKERLKMEEQLTEMKLKFFTNISHELRTPLSLIITPLESIVQKTENKNQKIDSAPIHSQLEQVLKHAHMLLDLVNRLLDFRKLSMGEMNLHPASGELVEFLRTCITSFIPLAKKKGNIIVQELPEENLYIDFDSKAMQHIMYNLLSNAIKYTANGTVTVRATIEDNKLHLTVSDTGEGISAEELPYIFDRYYQASNAQDIASPGTGIGLNMVKEIVDKMNGSITAESTPGKGTTFHIILPIALQNDKDMLPTDVVIPKLPSLLIADDNDDFRDFLVQELKNDYNILQARNGREALHIAQTNYVDVILSDVMMPQMDGNELCRQLKQDESTSHIFIILLTAKTAEENVLESYMAGADFYLTKPFSLKLLRNRLQHLTQLQQRRIELLSKSETQTELITEDELRISPIDHKFMEKMKEVMESHVADTSFSVDTFCSNMGMSRMNFYRKMHALTGKTPAQYINDYRLTLADQLLRKGELNVSEVSDRTGFTTASYFSKCYKAKFGTAPKDVRGK